MKEVERIHTVNVKDCAIEIPEAEPHIRICYIAKREDFLGYGLNLTADVTKPGQYVKSVQRKSPAEKSGLKEGDRILEVNDVSVGNESFKKVVARIMAVPENTKLKLVVLDQKAGRYYRNKNVIIKRHSDVSKVE